mgnify:CR=1 FL=1
MSEHNRKAQVLSKLRTLDWKDVTRDILPFILETFDLDLLQFDTFESLLAQWAMRLKARIFSINVSHRSLINGSEPVNLHKRWNIRVNLDLSNPHPPQAVPLPCIENSGSKKTAILCFLNGIALAKGWRKYKAEACQPLDLASS